MMNIVNFMIMAMVMILLMMKIIIIMKKCSKSRRCVGGVGGGQIHLNPFSSYISFRIIVTIIWIVRIIIVMITIIIVETHDHHGVHISQLFFE